MLRLIDANALNDELIERQYSEQSMGILHTPYPHMMAIVAKRPTVDAVEVVRCKDCKRWGVYPDGEDGMCHCLCRCTGKNDFCSYGERRTEE